jgi:hypothetical protein
MIIEVDPASPPYLSKPRDFGRFKVRAHFGRAAIQNLRAALDGLGTVADESTAWISESALRNWPHAMNDNQWQAGLTAMIEKAGRFGWIDANRGAISAHIEWQD